MNKIKNDNNVDGFGTDGKNLVEEKLEQVQSKQAF